MILFLHLCLSRASDRDNIVPQILHMQSSTFLECLLAILIYVSQLVSLLSALVKCASLPRQLLRSLGLRFSRDAFNGLHYILNDVRSRSRSPLKRCQAKVCARHLYWLTRLLPEGPMESQTRTILRPLALLSGRVGFTTQIYSHFRYCRVNWLRF